MANVYLGLGTNLGNKTENLRTAVDKINEKIGEVTSLSSFFETAPWGFQSDNSFLNAALCVRTSLSPQEVLSLTQDIERSLGRLHKSVNRIYSDRIIDIDLLLYNDLVLSDDNLVLPHPLMAERSFVLLPLAEIAAGVIHPLLHRTIGQLASELSTQQTK